MSWWSERVVPRLVDASLSAEPIAELRARAFADVRGRVLELGFGSGLNLPAYSPEVTSVHAVEPSDLAWERSQQRRARVPFPVDRVGLDGQDLDVDDASYDAVVCAFTLCTIPDPIRAIREVRRALVPGGALHLLEHGLAPDPGVVGWQRRLDRLQGAVFAGCRLTRDPLAVVAAGGLELATRQQLYLAPGPGKPWAYVTCGRAVAS